MKHQVLLKVFLPLLVIAAFTSPAFASEVIGTLSSDGNGNTQTTTTGGHSSSSGSQSASPNNGNLAGSVAGGTNTTSGGSGNGGNQNGQVLGENTMATYPARSATTTTKGGTSTVPPPIAQTENREGVSPDTDINDILPQAETGDIMYYTPVPQTASVFGAFSQFSPASLFSITALSLILIATLTYIYLRDRTAGKINPQLQ